MRTLTLSSIALALSLLVAPAAQAAEGEGHVEDVAFSWEGPFGTFDQTQLQRGLQIYTDVCAGCHGLKYVPLRSLRDLGYSEAQVRAYAATSDVVDKETGEERPGKPSDNFAARTGEGTGPDLSLMAKARAGFHGPYGLGINQLFRGMGGPEYIVSILTGYTGVEKEEAGVVLYENTAFPGGWISMPPPLSDGSVTFDPEHDNSLHHLAEDITAFLTWAAEPKMMARKHAGFLGVGFLALLSVLLYLTNKRLWAPHKHKAKA